MSKGIAYSSRDFVSIREELIDFVKKYYPDVMSDFNDASIGMMLIELNSAVSDMLSYNTDKMFNETQIDYAQNRNSILSMARTFGLKIPSVRPSMTIVDFSVTVPVDGDTFNEEYAPIIKMGTQVGGSGKIFETIDDIDFSSPFNNSGVPNRLILPNKDASSKIINYTLVKREMVVNGTSKIFKKVISTDETKPFTTLILPDTDVLSVTSIITKNGKNFNLNPISNEFLNEDLRWYEVDALAEDTIFIEDTNALSDNEAIKKGKWKRVSKKFIKEYTDNGYLKLTFGGGEVDTSVINTNDIDENLVNGVGKLINNISLGETLKANTTLFIKYRVGGGSSSNLGSNVIRNVITSDIAIYGSDSSINNAVRNSLKVNNPIPALGGKDTPSIEEVRNMVKYNFSAQNRAVTIKDYESRISQMPSEFGVPFRSGVSEERNKVLIHILGLDSNGDLTNQLTNTLKDNISTYLSDYRMLNDYVLVKDGKIVNLAFELDLMIDKSFPKSEVILNSINSIIEFMDINSRGMGENIYIGKLLELVNNVGGVTNIVDLRVFNKTGQGYSLNEIEQPYKDTETKEIDISSDYTLFGSPNTMFELKNPEININIRVK